MTTDMYGKLKAIKDSLFDILCELSLDDPDGKIILDILGRINDVAH